jgi:hypothetical protein
LENEALQVWIFLIDFMIYMDRKFISLKEYVQSFLSIFRFGLVLFCLCWATGLYAISCPKIRFYSQAQVEVGCETIELANETLNGVSNLFAQIDALNVRVNRRAWTSEQSEAKTHAYAIVWQDREYAFDEWGGFVIDRRYVLVEDLEIISRLETFFAVHYAQTAYAKNGNPLPIVPLVEVSRLPVFIGFEAARYQQHDELILKLVKEFNDNPAKAIGATEEMLIDIPYLNPALIKAMMIEESGGNGPRSTRAWAVDPLQVNVPGDWSEVKRQLGLHKPTARNEGTLEQNLRAGIAFLARKGFGSSGISLKKRPTAYFDSWRVALQRYNGRTAELTEGVTYAEAYANRILQRMQHAYKHVPIATDKYIY